MSNHTAFKRRFLHGFKPADSHFPDNFLENATDRFGYMFATAQNSGNPLNYSDRNKQKLIDLGKTMKDAGNTDNINTQIPAGYTYLGQFIDHNITFDMTSDLEKSQSARRIRNGRTANLDLDSVYGKGPDGSPEFYDSTDKAKLKIGNNSRTLDGTTRAFDLPREPTGEAIIGDPRNDENLVVAQMHLAFLKFHNAIVDDVRNDSAVPEEKVFETAQKICIQHYQWLLIEDYLKTISDPAEVDRCVNDIRNGQEGLQVMTKAKFPTFFIPVEFSVAAFRFGHTQVREDYNVNKHFLDQNFMELFRFTKFSGADMPGGGIAPLPDNWIIDWTWYFDVNGSSSKNEFNFSRKINSEVVPAMLNLPMPTPEPGQPSVPDYMALLSSRNLLRGMALKLPSGQFCAAGLGLPTMIMSDLLQGASDEQRTILTQHDNDFIRKTPLWFYILKEAEVQEGGLRLGKLGGGICREVFIRMWQESDHFDPNFRPTLGKTPGQFGIVDLLEKADMLQIPGIMSENA